jgi:DNA-directed RNA polymerase specialized sigma24 family protein
MAGKGDRARSKRAEPDEATLFEACRREEIDWRELRDLWAPMIFDYVFRMTGQFQRARETLEESWLALEQDLSRWETVEDLRRAFFSTARSFSADIWGGDTSRLQNAALDEESASEPGLKPAELEELRRVDAAFRALPGPLRETLLLTRMYKFSTREAARLLNVEDSFFEERLQMAQGVLAGGDLTRVASCLEIFERLPSHPMPVTSAHGTKDLSHLVRDIRDARWTPWAWWGVVFTLLAAGSLVWWFWGEQLSAVVRRLF